MNAKKITKNLLKESYADTNTPQEQQIIKQTISKMSLQDWNKLFFTNMQSFTEDDFGKLQQLSTYLYTRYLEYQKNPRQYNKNIK